MRLLMRAAAGVLRLRKIQPGKKYAAIGKYQSDLI